MKPEEIGLEIIDAPDSFREQLDEEHAAKLAESVDSLPPPFGVKKGGRVKLTGGGLHRHRAHQIARKKTMWVMLIEEQSPLEQIANTGRENIVRKSFNPREIARLIVAAKAHGLSQAESCELIGISAGQGSRAVAISKALAPDLQDKVAEGELDPSKAYLLTPLPHDKQREGAAKDMKRDQLAGWVKGQLGKIPKRNRRLRFKANGLEASYSGSMEELLGDLVGTARAVRKAIRLGLGPESLPKLLTA